MNKVLVYGSLREGGALDSNMIGATRLGDTRVRGRMVSASSYYPAVIVDGVPEDETVLGEVYEITDDHLHHLDMVEGHPNFYHRIQVPTEDFGEVWMYIWESDKATGRDVVPDGDWMKYWRG